MKTYRADAFAAAVAVFVASAAMADGFDICTFGAKPDGSKCTAAFGQAFASFRSLGDGSFRTSVRK